MKLANSVVPSTTPVNALSVDQLSWQQHGPGNIADWTYFRMPIWVLDRLMVYYPNPEQWKVVLFFAARVYGCDTVAMHHGAEGSLREIAAAIGEESSLGTVQRALKGLVEDGVLARMRHPHNPRSYLYHFRDPREWTLPAEKPRRKPYYRRKRAGEALELYEAIERMGLDPLKVPEILAHLQASEAEGAGEVSTAVEVLASAQERTESRGVDLTAALKPNEVNVVVLPVERERACREHPKGLNAPPSAPPPPPVDNAESAYGQLPNGESRRSASSGSVPLYTRKTSDRTLWDLHALYVRRGSRRSFVATTLVSACAEILTAAEKPQVLDSLPLPKEARRYVADGGSLWALASATPSEIPARLAVWLSKGLALAGWEGRWRPPIVARAIAAAFAEREHHELLSRAAAAERAQEGFEWAQRRWPRLQAEVLATLEAAREHEDLALEASASSAIGQALTQVLALERVLQAPDATAAPELPLLQAALEALAGCNATLRTKVQNRQLEQRRAVQEALQAEQLATGTQAIVEAFPELLDGVRAEAGRLQGLGGQLPQLESILTLRREGRWTPEERERRRDVYRTLARHENLTRRATDVLVELVDAEGRIAAMQRDNGWTPAALRALEDLVQRARQVLDDAP